MQTRKTTIADVPLLLPLVEAYWRFEGIDGFDRQRVAGQLERLLGSADLGAGWIALRDGVPLGYLLLVYVFSLEHLGLTAEIDEFFVVESARSAGAGSRLLCAAEQEAARRGCTSISLQLGRGNDAARQFYVQRGYAAREAYELMDKTLR